MTSTAQEKNYKVRAVHCDYQSTDQQVYEALKRATDPLDRAWTKLSKARRIGIKFNQDWAPQNVKWHAGHRQQLVSDPVARAVLRLLREHTRAELYAIDIGVDAFGKETTREAATNLLPVLREFDVPFIDGIDKPVAWVPVPGGGQMFDRYPIPQTMTETDAVVSVQKLKNHGFMGVTLCLKNLFGLIPMMPHGRPRGYYHHLVRMPYMLTDLGRIFNPALNVIDGLVCQAGEEWGKGDYPRICNTLVAGDQVIATDACGTYLMGHDPQSDWLTPPFHRDRNALLTAAESGFGTVNLNEIDFQSEVKAPVGEFFNRHTDSRETVVSWRRTAAEQALYYREHKEELAVKHAGEYILLQMGQVRWADKSGNINVSRRVLSGEHPEQSMLFKYVDPLEEEGEHYEVYEKTLQQMQAMKL